MHNLAESQFSKSFVLENMVFAEHFKIRELFLSNFQDIYSQNIKLTSITKVFDFLFAWKNEKDWKIERVLGI